MRLVFPGEADAAVHLNAVGSDPAERGRTHRLSDTDGQFRIVASVGQRPHCVVCRRAGVFEIDEHIGKPVLYRLEGSDVAAELEAGLGVLHR